MCFSLVHFYFLHPTAWCFSTDGAQPTSKSQSVMMSYLESFSLHFISPQQTFKYNLWLRAADEYHQTCKNCQDWALSKKTYRLELVIWPRPVLPFSTRLLSFRLPNQPPGWHLRTDLVFIIPKTGTQLPNSMQVSKRPLSFLSPIVEIVADTIIVVSNHQGPRWIHLIPARNTIVLFGKEHGVRSRIRNVSRG